MYNADYNPGRRPASEVVLNPHSSVNPDFALPDVFDRYWQEANRGQHWNGADTAALLGIWGDDKIQSQLDGAYFSNLVFQKIATVLASRGDTHDRTIFFSASLEILRCRLPRSQRKRNSSLSNLETPSW